MVTHPERFADLLGGGEAAQIESHWLCEAVRQAGFIRRHEVTCLAASRRVNVRTPDGKMGWLLAPGRGAYKL